MDCVLSVFTLILSLINALESTTTSIALSYCSVFNASTTFFILSLEYCPAKDTAAASRISGKTFIIRSFIILLLPASNLLYLKRAFPLYRGHLSNKSIFRSFSRGNNSLLRNPARRHHKGQPGHHTAYQNQWCTCLSNIHPHTFSPASQIDLEQLRFPSHIERIADSAQ